ncbi:MAG TPA: substrate-binding domain-containing protein [Burkholderiaceae bacterium]
MRPIMQRRAWVGAMAALAVAPAWAQRRPGDRMLALGAETLLVDAGFGAALRRRFGRDTGLALRVEPGPSTALLQALARGEIDLALTHAPALAARLEADGTIYGERSVARTDFLLAGPQGSAGASHNVLTELTLLAERRAPFLTRNDGSGTHLAEQALWRLAGIAPAEPWYRPLDPAGGPLLAQAHAAGAACLVDRATWLAPSGAARGLAVLCEGDSLLATELRVHRSLVSAHPAAKLFLAWLTGPAGRALVARTRGLRAPT